MRSLLGKPSRPALTHLTASHDPWASESPVASVCPECLAESSESPYLMCHDCRQEYAVAVRRRREAEQRLQPLADFVEVSS